MSRRDSGEFVKAVYQHLDEKVMHATGAHVPQRPAWKSGHDQHSVAAEACGKHV